MTQPDYRLHHVCIYDAEPRDSMWPYLRWSHTLLAHFWEAGDMMLTDEGHVDYYFLGCGNQFYLQFESPPFQFEYENDWYARHGRSYNHITWMVGDSKQSFADLTEIGAPVVFPFTEFGEAYNGHVVLDPEGRWVEVMTCGENFRIPELVSQPTGLNGLQVTGVKVLSEDPAGIAGWYETHLGMRTADKSRDGELITLHGAEERPEPGVSFVICSPGTEPERDVFDRHGPSICALIYQARDVAAAYEEALAAGLAGEQEPAADPRTGIVTGWLREPSGNLLELREALA